MSIEISVQSTKHSTPPRKVIYGGEKVGKSTYAAQAPNPWFLPTEQGLSGLDAQMIVANDDEGNPKNRLETFGEFDAALTFCENNLDKFETLVIDSVDWLESLIHAQIVANDKYNNMAEACGGYGKAYLEAENWFRYILARLDRINQQGKMIILIGHAKAVTFNDPLSEPYDIWEPKLHTTKKGTGMLEVMKEWADIIGFAEKEKRVRTTKADETKGRAVDMNKRSLHLESTAGFIAGNRYGLPPKIDLTMAAFMDAFNNEEKAKK